MPPEIIILSESEEGRRAPSDITCTRNYNRTQTSLSTKQNHKHRTDWPLPMGRWGGMDWGRQVQTIIYRMGKQQGAPYSTSVVNALRQTMVENFKYMHVYVCICTELYHCAIQQKLLHFKSTTLQCLKTEKTANLPGLQSN